MVKASRYAPHGAECGTVVEIEDRRLVEDPDRYGTKADGGDCSLSPRYTVKVNGEEIALCTRHRKADVEELVADG